MTGPVRACASNPELMDVSRPGITADDVRQAEETCLNCPAFVTCLTNEPREIGLMVATVITDYTRSRGPKRVREFTADEYIQSRNLDSPARRTGRKPASELAAHGSRAARRRHYRRGEPLCDVCAVGARPRLDALRKAMALVPHGTEEGVAAHERYGGGLCVPCARWAKARKARVRVKAVAA